MTTIIEVDPKDARPGDYAVFKAPGMPEPLRAEVYDTRMGLAAGGHIFVWRDGAVAAELVQFEREDSGGV